MFNIYSTFSSALEGLLNAATDKYDDIRVAMTDYKTWEGKGQIWPEEEEKMVRKFILLHLCYNPFSPELKFFHCIDMKILKI